MRTVAQEMSAEERRIRLLKGLEATEETTVVVNFSHLAHAVGMDVAEGLIIKLVAMEGLVRTPYSREPRLESVGLCEIDRYSTIEMIKRTQVKTAKQKIDQLVKQRSN